jgi:hypothetical protein
MMPGLLASSESTNGRHDGRARLAGRSWWYRAAPGMGARREAPRRP